MNKLNFKYSRGHGSAKSKVLVAAKDRLSYIKELNDAINALRREYDRVTKKRGRNDK